MAAKFIVLSLLVASVCCSDGYSSFSYGIVDPNTGDVKDQHEKRVGDSVVGKYSLLESDGTKRIVEYEANAATGFNAVVRNEPIVGLPPSGPLVGPANGSVAPAQSISIAPAALAAPIAPAHAVPIAPVEAQVHREPIGQPGALPHPGANPQSGILSHPDGHPHPGPPAAPGALLPHPIALDPFNNLQYPGSIVHPSTQGHPGTLPAPAALADTGTLGHQTPLFQSAALSHQTVFAQHGALGHRGVFSHPGAIGSLANPAGITHPSPANQVNPLAGNFVRPGYAPFTGANGYSSPVAGPQGIPSHFSNSIVHEAPRAYPGSYAFGYNGAYGGDYSGVYGGYGGAYGGYGSAYGRYGAYGQPNAFGAPFVHGFATSLGNGIIGPRGLAHSYTSLTRGEAYPHRNGGFGDRFNGGYGAGIGAGLPW